jgi:hypothetical protein
MRKCNDEIYQLAKDQALVKKLKNKRFRPFCLCPPDVMFVTRDIQHNDQKNKRTKNDLQNITRQTKDRVLVIRTPLKTAGERRCSGKVESSVNC